MLNILKKLTGSKNEREIKKLWPLVKKINDFEAEVKKLDNPALQNKTNEFRQRIENGESLDSLLPEAFAVAREASVRILGMRHFDVQLIGGISMHQGKIAEMKTGEGKTLTATAPVYLNAISGKGVHVVTVNDYLASRDAEWMGQVYNFLGLSSGCIVNDIGHRERQKAYGGDITYGQNNEFGFDYLRDNMKMELEDKVQREHNFAIVDEVDSILVDESRTPLIISGPSEKPTELYAMADGVVRKLVEEKDYEIDIKSKTPTLTEEGVQNIEKILEIENLYDPKFIETVHHINQSLKARKTLHRDTDYVVRGGEIIIVDEFTGRLMSGRRWSDGLHQAIEAKEKVKIKRENHTLATITFQNYFRMYDKLAGMTGTADTEAVEFKQIYNLDVLVIPTNEPMARKDMPDTVYPTEKGKYLAVAEEIKDLQETGQPVLVGTASIAKSEELSEILKKQKVPHHVLNAKYHEQEAEIVAQAGRVGAVTISTNMAGRGTDILLGGNPEFLALEKVEADDPEFEKVVEECKVICEEQKQKVKELGGLFILGTERHESRRIDNQLRGRAGRQGDPGVSRFFISLEDDLMKRFGGDKLQHFMSRVGLKESDAIEGALVGRAIENAQRKVESFHYEQRKQLLEYDDVMNKQREVIYDAREKILSDKESEKDFKEIIQDVIEDIVMTYSSDNEVNHKSIYTDFNRLFGFELEASEEGDAQELFEKLTDLAWDKYQSRKERTGEDNIKHLKRIRHLQGMDHYWKEHLTNMDHLREGIFLRGYGQEKPIHVYQREGFQLFTQMMFAVKTSLISNVFVPELPSLEELKALEEQEKERLRQREAAARAVHEEAASASSKGGKGTKDEDPELAGMNREQRRKAKKKKNKRSR